MTAESERFIVDCLNDEPFKLNTTLIAFDNSPPQKLLQILSDVICWITQTEKIDIRTEQADETAMRMFHNLRILKYRPPSDIEQLEEWRVGMVEGSRAAVFPVLYYLLSNVDMLKERAYLARFLVRVDVPGEVQDVDTLNMQNEILAAMERFKEVHKQVVEVRGDTLMVVDIKNDLRSMEQEKEQLNRRIDKVQRKVQAMPNLEKILSSAEMYRKEVERFEQLNAQRSEQRNVVIYIEQKIQRLQQQLKDTQSAGENLDPTDLIHQLEAELETNAYLVNVKLEKEIQTKRGIVSELSKVADMPAIGQNDIDKLKEEVTTLTDHIIQLEEERDKKEETHDENYSIYRHQAATVERKKSAAAQKLQEARTELDLLQKEIVEKKEELRNSSGEEVITSVQFKNFVNKLRQTTITYKKKRSELEDVKAENLVLTRTMEILSQQWVDLKERIEDKGGDVIESIEVPQNNRPKTAMPKTDDKDQLRDMVVTLNTTLDERREHLVPLQERHETRRRMFEQKHDEMRNMKREYERTKADLESEFERLQEESDSLEERYQSAYAKEKMLQVQVGSLEADLDKLRNSQGADLLKKIDDERIKTEAETDMLKSRATQQVDVAAARMQMNMWKSLLKLFEKKLEIVSNEPTKSFGSDEQHITPNIAANDIVKEPNTLDEYYVRRIQLQGTLLVRMSQLPRVGFRPVENDVLECFESPRCIRPGADIEIIRLVFKLMGEDFELVNVEKEFNLGFDFGSLVNGSWTGVMGLLIEDKLDMFGVNMRTTVDRSRDVLFSYPIKMFQSVLLIKPPCDTIENNFVFKGFATTVWILLCITFFTIIFVNILFYLVEQRISGWRTDKINIRMIDSAAMKTFLPLRTCSRFHRNVLYAAVLPCLFFILQMYQMKMYSFLATNLGFVIPFHTMDKAIEAVSNGDYFFAGFTYPLLSPAMDAKFKKAIEKNPFHFAKSTAEAQDLIASSTAVYQSVLDSDILPGDVSWLFKDQQILVIRDEMSQGYYAAYAFSKKNKKLRDRFNSALMYLLPAVGHISTGHGYASRKIKYESSQAKLIYLSLTTHMAQLFKCYLIGIALSVSAFAIESLFYLIYRLRTTKRRTSMLVDAKLSNGSHMPFVGLGTGGKRCEPELTRKMLHTALDVGYRHIDTAALYSTEEIIGEVIEEYINSGKLKRSDLFITTKLSPINNHPDRVEEALNRQLAKLRTDYVDMYLIHTPISMKDKGSYHMDLSQIQSYEYDLVNLVDIWHEMEKLCESGKAKSIGVSNFSERQIETLIDGAKKYKPMNNQIEVHLHFPQKELVEFCQRNNIVVTAYAPIGCPSKKSEEKFGWPSEVAVDDPAVIALAEKYERTPAQILLRQLIHRGIVVIPKSTNEERLKQNLDVFDFKLTAEELNVLDAIPPRSRLYKFVGQVDHPDFPFPDIIAARKSGLI